MNQDRVAFRSVTYAQGGERSLEKQGTAVSLGRTPKWMEQQGCGYGLKLRISNIQDAALALAQDGVSWRKIYVWEAGSYREMAL